MSATTEAPTPRRLEQARKKGQFARSGPLSTWTVLSAAGVGLGLAAPWAAAQTMEWTRRAWALEGTPQDVTWSAAPVVAGWVLPPMVGACLGGLVAGWVQAGWQPTPGLVLPDAERISASAGLKRLVSWQRTFGVLRACALLGVVLVLMVSWFDAAGAVLLAWPQVRWDVGLVAWWECLSNSGGRLAVILGVFAAVDWALAAWRHRREMRMSRDEIRREHRETEGDPLAKGQRRAMHRALVGAAVAKGVRSANVVVVNPTHIAVALRYAPAEADAPFVVARGAEDEAFAIREEAKRLGIPLVRNVPLARSLVRLAPGEEVPEELYRAAAAVLGMVQGEERT